MGAAEITGQVHHVIGRQLQPDVQVIQVVVCLVTRIVIESRISFLLSFYLHHHHSASSPIRASKIQKRHHGAQKWPTVSGKRSNLRLVDYPIKF